MNYLIATLLALGAGAAWAAEEPGTYREAQPEVLDGAARRAGQQAAAEAQTVARFKSAYAQAKRPAFLMMWHRELSDDIDSGRQVTASSSSTGMLARDNHERTLTVQWKNGAERPVSLLPAARDAEFASGFHQALRGAGAALVDRNTAIRMQALRQVKAGTRESELNFQTVEAATLAQAARYFIELRFVPDAEARDGSQPRVTVIDSGNGEILADLMPSALYKAQDSRWVATGAGFVRRSNHAGDGEWTASEKGFEKQARAPRGAEEGRLVALALMQALAEAWTPAPGR